MKTIESKVLTADEKKINKEFQKELEFCRHCDVEIEKNLTRKGECLIRIREEQLYKVMYKTFEEAIVAELKISKREGYRLIEDVSTITNLKMSPKGDQLVTQMNLSTGAIRALSASADDAASQIEVLEHIKKNDIPLTAKSIAQVADEILPPRIVPDKPAKSKPVDEPAKDPEPSPATGRPSHGTKFDPSEWEEPEEKPSAKKLPKFIEDVIEQTKAGKTAINALIQIKKTLRSFCQEEAGSWMNVQEHDRLIDQLMSNIKHGLYESVCPRCRGKRNDKACLRCAGRGWLDRGHSRQNTDDDRAWLEAK